MKIDRAQRQRREIKYIIDENKAMAVRAFVQCYLLPDENAEGKPNNSYEVHTLYLDSNHLRTFHAANDGERNRFKLRIRYYDDDPLSPVFFEIKRRLSEGIVKQRARVKRDAVKALLLGEPPRREFLYAESGQQWVDLLDFWQLVEKLEAAPRAHNAYLREAYVSPGKGNVRVTIDRAVRIEPEFSGILSARMTNPVEVFGGVVILELKFTDRMPMWMIEMVRGFELKSCGAAKYVRGVEILGVHKVARRMTGFEWGSAITNTLTSAPWLDNSAALRGALGPNRQ
ncbi:MAG: polyphosphate polymerase domain-containing protein [Verrucomicrobia bacterium]|nr:polyphosphate polymerase domain-containing protein [Verrucomicrobiota bacterium]